MIEDLNDGDDVKWTSTIITWWFFEWTRAWGVHMTNVTMEDVMINVMYYETGYANDKAVEDYDVFAKGYIPMEVT